MTLREREILLLQRIKKGDEQAYIQLVTPYRERLFRKAVSMVKDADDAEDIVQDTMISGYKSIANFRAESGVYTWLYRIVVNKSKDLLTKKKRTREKPLEENGESNYLDERMGYEKKLELSQESEYLIKKINELDPLYLQIIKLRYFQDLSYSEIALEIGSNVGTVKSRLFKAKESLKQALLQDSKGEGYFENSE